MFPSLPYSFKSVDPIGEHISPLLIPSIQPSSAPPSIYNQVPIVTPHLLSMPPVENSSIAWICALNYELHKNPTRGLCTAHKKAFLLCLIKPSLRFPFVWFKTNRFISISQKIVHVQTASCKVDQFHGKNIRSHPDYPASNWDLTYPSLAWELCPFQTAPLNSDLCLVQKYIIQLWLWGLSTYCESTFLRRAHFDRLLDREKTLWEARVPSVNFSDSS